MSRPADKDALLAAAASEFAKLRAALDRFPDAQRLDIAWQAPLDDQSRNPRDVVAHLHAWQEMTLGWCAVGDAGGTPEVPGPGLTWRDLPALNADIWERFARTSYEEVWSALITTHERCLAAIDAHTDDQLFGRQQYAWTKSSTLGAYFVSSTSSHYVWGVKTLRAIAKHLP